MSPNPVPSADVTHPGGMEARRVMPTEIRQHLDPFVLFERFSIDPDQGFDTHPHRGFEIVSYMLAGGMAHEDSMGHSSVARPGDAMRITTGSGMSHSELPADGESCAGLQLWVNLPRDRKPVEPGYEDASAAELPTEHTEGATVTTVVGEGSPIDLHTEMSYLDVLVRDRWTWAIPEGWVGFCFAVSGEGEVDAEPIAKADCLIAEEGGRWEFETEGEVRVAAIAGKPHGEPIRHRGPFVD